MSGIVRIVHNNEGSFPCHHSQLSAEALASRVLTEYEIGQVIECNILSPGLNDTYFVRTTTNKYVLRVYQVQRATGRTWRTIADINYEIDLLLHISSKGVAVSTPVVRKDGAFIQTIQAAEGIRPVVLFTYAPGTSMIPPMLTKELSMLYGRAIADIHAASDDFVSVHERFPLDLSFLLDTSLQTIQPVLAHRTDDWEYLVELAQVLKWRIAQLASGALDIGPCHGDASGTNAGLTDEKVLTFFDFDAGGRGWRPYDLAVFCWRMALAKKQLGLSDEESEALFMAYLQGYQERRPLSDLNIQSIPLFVAVRHYWFMALNVESWNYHGWEEPNDSFFDEEMAFLQEWVEQYRI